MDPKTAQKKIKITSDLFDIAVRIKSHQLRLKNPQATDQEIKSQVIALIEKGCK